MMKRNFWPALLLWLCPVIANCQQSSIQANELTEKKINEIISKMTLEEKLKMCSGADPEMAFSGIKRLNIPNVLCTDGPRGPNQRGIATAFPSGLSFGASWNLQLVEQAGKVMGTETRAKGFGVLLGPGNNILRDPLNGRFFEYYTEDPYLNSGVTVAAVKGIQSGGVAASLKHYACNNREDNRNNYMSMVDDRTLNEIYLPAYKAAVRDGKVMTIMTSANGVNNEFVSDSKKMLTDILKNKWGFDGFVLTDWLQTRSTEKAALAGLDVSMPGGNNCGFGKPLFDAVKQGRVPIAVIEDKVRRVLRVYDRLGLLDGKFVTANVPLNTAQHQALAQQVAEEGIVLLKNERNVLPLSMAKTKKILVMGPNADKYLCKTSAGGSSGIVSPYEITPLKGLVNLLGESKVQYLSSSDLGGFQLIPANVIVNADRGKGFKASYFVKGKDAPALKRIDSAIDFMWEMKSPDASIKPDDFSKARYEASIIPPMDGKYTIRLIVNGIARLYHGDSAGEPLAFNDSRQTLWVTNTSVNLKKGEPYALTIDYKKVPGDAAIRLEWELPEAPAEKLKVVDKAAREADAVIYVGGIDHSMDTEGRDRRDLNFPGAQENILKRLAGQNKNLIVVLVNGSPLELGGWLSKVPVVLEAWYPGMEGGRAVANVLFGKVNPSGKLPFSWPKKLADSPSQVLGSQNNDVVNYTDSLMVGYRYYDTRNVAPEFPFGYGLSYTKFKLSDFTATHSRGRVTGTIKIKNTGALAGAEVVQLYIKPLQPSVKRPVHELKWFKKVMLLPGKEQQLSFELDAGAFSYYDVQLNDWKLDAGKYEIEVGTSSRDIQLKTQLVIDNATF